VVHIGQLVYEQYKDEAEKMWFRIGVVTKRYDQVFIMLTKVPNNQSRSCSYTEIKDVLSNDEVGVITLKDNNKPVFAKKNIFGRFKF
jgi:hypothetical protein